MPGTSRRSLRQTEEKRKVMHSAKHPIESSLGRTLLKTNFSDTSVLSAELQKLEKLKKRHRMHSVQEKKCFLQNRNLPEPTLLVERPPSPDTLKKCYPNTGDTHPDHSHRPRFMHQITSRVRTPSNFVTIDAFSVKTKKKTNYWDVGQDSGDTLRFHSAFVPSFRLTSGEISDLQRACSTHPGFQRPLSATGEKLASAGGDPRGRFTSSRERNQTPSRQKLRVRTANDQDLPRDPDTVFITELHPNHRPQSFIDQAIKTVTFANKMKTDDGMLELKRRNKLKKFTKLAQSSADNNKPVEVFGDVKKDRLQNLAQENSKVSIWKNDTITKPARKAEIQRIKRTGRRHVKGFKKIEDNISEDNDLEDFEKELDVTKETDKKVVDTEDDDVKPPEDEVPDVKAEIRRWLKKTYEFL